MRQAHHLVIIGADLGTVVQWIYCAGDLDGLTHLPADRFSQPTGGIDQLGMGLLLLR